MVMVDLNSNTVRWPSGFHAAEREDVRSDALLVARSLQFKLTHYRFFGSDSVRARRWQWSPLRCNCTSITGPGGSPAVGVGDLGERLAGQRPEFVDWPADRH